MKRIRKLPGIKKISSLLGFDTAREKYAYGEDALFGHVSAQRVADTWVKTTCGYCSVGCGMLLGIRDGKVVSSRGMPDHPVSHGKLCPKGLAEHYAISAPGRATHPMLRRDGVLQQVSWTEAMQTMAGEFRRIQQRHGADAVGIISTGQLLTEEFMRWANWPSSDWERATSTATRRCVCPPRLPVTSARSAAMALRVVTRTFPRPTSSC